LPKKRWRDWSGDVADLASLTTARPIPVAAPPSVAAGLVPRPGRLPLPVRILGLDPGSILTGYGVIDCDAEGIRAVAWGSIRAQGDSLAARLRCIHARLAEVVAQFEPQEVAYERPFVHRNADSAIKLGQALGAGLAACFARAGVVQEYPPSRVKQAVVGRGSAAKA